MDIDTAALAARLTGSLLRPGDPDFDDVCSGYQQHDPHRPDVVVLPATPADVVTAVRFAAERQLPVAVQASGHGRGAGLDGGVLISTRDLTALDVDPATRTARAGAGVRWREVLDAAGAHGLAPLSGTSPGVGVVGYTLGGGTGWLGRRYGYAADHVVRVDLVTLDGALHEVTAESDPELFWALRGGGGSFGIVTAIEFELVDVPTVFGGSLTVDVAAQPDVLSRWRDWSADLPDAATTAISVLTMPDVVPVPELLRGRQLAAIQLAFVGTAEAGEQLVAPLRDLDPIKDTLREMVFSDSGEISEEPDRPHAYHSSDRLVAAVPDVAVAALLHVSSPDDTADAARSLQDATLARFDDAGVTLGTSLNFAYGPMSQDARRAAFDDGVVDRLAVVARRCDPDGRLRSNHPVR